MAGYNVERTHTTIVTNDGPKNIFGNSPFQSGGDSTTGDELMKCVKVYRLEGTWWIARRYKDGVSVTYDGVYSEECRCVPMNSFPSNDSSQGPCPKNTNSDGGCAGVPSGFTDQCGTFCTQRSVDLGPCFKEEDCTCYRSKQVFCNGIYYYNEGLFPPIINPPEEQYTWVEGEQDHGHAFECLAFHADADEWNQLCRCKGGGYVPTF